MKSCWTLLKIHIRVIKMEVERNYGPENNFLSKVRDLATKKNIVLILMNVSDLETYGGIHKKYILNQMLQCMEKPLVT